MGITTEEIERDWVKDGEYLFEDEIACRLADRVIELKERDILNCGKISR